MTTSQDQRSHTTKAAETNGRRLWQERHHLLDTNDLHADEISVFLDVAQRCRLHHQNASTPPILQGLTVGNLFYENSTRTRSSFEMAARQLGASVLNLNTKLSSVTKGESIADTAKQLAAMHVAAIVQRHSAAGSAALVAGALGKKVHLLNAGDGWHSHPTQALLDLLTMHQVKPNLAGAKIAIIGDITHSRVARSNICLLRKVGLDIHVAGPPTLLPPSLAECGVTVHSRLEPAIEKADFVMMLRLQLERQQQGLIPGIGEYRRLFRLDHQRLQLAKPGVRVMHPGPVNRNVEVTDDLVDDENVSLLMAQVTNGVAARMAVLYLLLADIGVQL